MRSCWRVCNAEQKGARATFHAGTDLFLEPARARHIGRAPIADALGRELSFVCSCSDVVRIRVVWARRASSALALLDEVAHRRDGPFVRLDVDRFLRGQRKAVAGLEKYASFHLLAAASFGWLAIDSPSASLAPADAKTQLVCV